MTDTRPDAQPAADVAGLLAGIRSPRDVQALQREELPALCDEVRGFLLDTVQSTGGHLGSNLGVVELTVALHYLFDFRRDRLIWDVSHQCYPHKVLTGRRDGFAQLRRSGGMCGFTNPRESEYDLFHTGHAGTSISLGLGLAQGFAHEADPPMVVSVVGDASLGAGVAFEALNHAGALGLKQLVVLNDNEWSISKSVGALAKYLARIRSNRLVQRAGQETKNLIHAIPIIGPKVDKTLDDIGEVMRHMVVPGHVFEELGVRYVGPVDGHDVRGLVSVLDKLRKLDGCLVLHVLTEKGKGHPDGPSHPERVHAVKARAAKKVLPDKTEAADARPRSSAVPFTKAFAGALCDLAERDMRVHALTAAMPSGTGLTGFAERFPSRFHDTGITEQHAVAFAAGMAKAGLRPVAAIYSTFLQRGYDQCFQEVALQNLPVTFALDRAGPVGQDGPTHNGVFDIAYLRALPNFVLGSPRDETDVRRMLYALVEHDGPAALRFPRGDCPTQEVFHESERRPMEPGKAEVLRRGDKLVLWAYGHMVQTALAVAESMRHNGAEVGVVDARFVKPLDVKLLAEHARAYRHIVTLEAHQRSGGFGSAVLEAWSRLPLGEGAQARVRILGIPDRFLEHETTPDDQLAAVGLDAAGVERSLRKLLAHARTS
jgi:1-deoxy-D-xylulose-5-phosphate synthase